MGESFLIYGGTPKLRNISLLKLIAKLTGKELTLERLEKMPDIRFLNTLEDKKSIGIAETKESAKFLSIKPFNLGQKILIIVQAEKMTRESQNSLLKTLEEPPSYASIILCTKTLNDLLETVISRCKKISAEERGHTIIESGEKVVGESFKNVLKMSSGQKLDFASEVSKEEKEDVVEMLEQWIKESRGVLLKNPGDAEMVKNIKLVIAIKNDLENTNTNLKLNLESLILHLGHD